MPTPSKKTSLLILLGVFLCVGLTCALAPAVNTFLLQLTGQKIEIADALPATEKTASIEPATVFQNQPATVEKKNWKSYTTVMESEGIRALAFDKNGALWTVGSGGAVRWDVAHQTYTKFMVEHGLISNNLFSIAVAPDGVVWVGAETGGISKYDGKDWTSFRLPGTRAWFEEVHAIQVNLDKTVFAGVFSNFGLMKEEGDRWERITGDDGPGYADIGVVFRASDGSDWVGVHGNDPSDSVPGRGGIYHFDGQKWQHFDQKDGVISNVIVGIVEYPAGVIWAATPRGLARFDGKTWLNFTAKSGLVDSPITAILTGSDQAMWLATQKGLTRFDGKTWTHYNLGLTVTALAQGADGAIWFGSEQGLHVMKANKVATYQTRDDLPGNQVTRLATSSNGEIWCPISRLGLLRYNGSKASLYQVKDGLAGDPVLAIQPVAEDNIWFGTDNGISHYQHGQWQTFDPSNGTHKRYDIIYADPYGRIWAANGTDAWVFKEGNWKHIAHIEKKYPGIGAITVGEDGAMWFAMGEGVSRLDGNNWTEFTEKDGLPYDRVDSLVTAKDGSIWAGTVFGRARYDGQKWETIDASMNLSPIPGRMAAAKDGSIWIAGFGGVTHFDVQRNRQILTSMDGLASDQVWDVAEAPDGSIWFATSGGLSRFTP